jgi:prepilin-type processing-associated H-X9-DG protein
MLLPALTRTKESARRALCLSIFKEQLVGIAMFADDNDEALLPGHRYANYSNDDEAWGIYRDVYEAYRDEYMGGEDKMFSCPNMLSMGMPRYWTGPGTMQMMGFNYLGNKPNINSQGGAPYSYPVGKFGQLEDAEDPLFSDLNNWSVGFSRTMVAHTGYGAVADAGFLATVNIPGAGGSVPAAVGSEGGNYGYQDGHARWRPINGLTQYATFYRAGNQMGWDLFPKEMWQ